MTLRELLLKRRAEAKARQESNKSSPSSPKDILTRLREKRAKEKENDAENQIGQIVNKSSPSSPKDILTRLRERKAKAKENDAENQTGQIVNKSRIIHDVNLVDTVWQIKENADDSLPLTVTFQANNVLINNRFKFRTQSHLWNREGDVVVIKFNRGYATYAGKISGNTIIGSAWNIVGDKWPFTAEMIHVSNHENNSQSSAGRKYIAPQSQNSHIMKFIEKKEKFVETNDGDKYNFAYYYLTRYYPKNRYPELPPNEYLDRIQVWDFKNGDASEIVARKLAEAILEAKINLNDACVVVIPASTQDKTDDRFESFCEEISELLRIENCFDAITTKDHEATKGKAGGNKVMHFTFSEHRYSFKHVLLFDDVITSGTSFLQVATILMSGGALSVTGIFLAKTSYKETVL